MENFVAKKEKEWAYALGQKGTTLTVLAVVNILLVIVEIWNPYIQLKNGYIGFGPITFLLHLTFFTPIWWKKIKMDELGSVSRLGKPRGDLEYGLKIRIPGLDRIQTETRKVLQTELPGEPEKVKDNPDPEKGEVLPIRITNLGKENSAEKGDVIHPLERTMTNEYAIPFRWKIISLTEFLMVFGTIEDFYQQVRDEVERFLAAEISSKTTLCVIEKIGVINEGLEKRVKDIFYGVSGVAIIDIGIKKPNIGKAINLSFKEQASIELKAQADSRATRINADAEKERLVEEGTGVASAIKSKIIAEGEGMKQKVSDLGIDGATLVAQETAQTMASNGNIIVAGNVGDATNGLIGAVVTATKVHEKTRGDQNADRS